MTARSRTLRNTAFSSVGMYTEYVLGMLTSIIIARHLGPDGFGAYSAVIWLVAMGVAGANSGTASAAIKFVAELRGAGRDALIPPLVDHLRGAQRRYLAVVLALGALVLWLAGRHVAPSFHHGWLLLFLCVSVVLRASYMFNIGVAKGFEDFRANAIVALVATPTNLAMVVAVWWFDLPVEWLLWSFALSSVIFYAMSRAQVRRIFSDLAIPAHAPGVGLPDDLVVRVRRQMVYSTLTVTVGFIVASEVEVMFLNLYADPHAAGQFKVAYQLAVGAVALVPGVFGALLLPMMANALSQGRAVAGQRFVATTAYLALLAMPLVAFGVVFSGELIALLYGAEYLPAGPVFAICLAGTALATMTQGGSSLLVSADRQRSVLAVVVACGLIKIGLDALLIHHDGLRGAVVAFAIVSLVNALSMMTLAIRASGVAPDWGRLARIGAAATLAALLVWPLRGRLFPVADLAVGGLLLVLLYALFTLLLGCWHRGDIEYLQELHQRFVAGRPRFGARLLRWAHARAGGG